MNFYIGNKVKFKYVSIDTFYNNAILLRTFIDYDKYKCRSKQFLDLKGIILKTGTSYDLNNFDYVVKFGKLHQSNFLEIELEKINTLSNKIKVVRKLLDV